MRVDGTIRYAGADPVRVFAMLIDPDFQRQKCAATGAIRYDVEIKQDKPDTEIVCCRTLPTDGLPDFVRPFAANGLELVETVTWGQAATSGARAGELELGFTAQPLSMTGVLTMTAHGGGTVATLQAELTASVPLLGARIEKACEPLVQKALRIEESVATRWLREHR